MANLTMTPQYLAEILKQQSTKCGLSIEQQQQLLNQIQGLAKPPILELDRIITNNQGMLKLKDKIVKLKAKDIPCLIIGETGTGKELVARALHNGRKGKFIGVNCAGIPRELFESEFFGVTKGAYTGCINSREGYFEQAQNGTIFLDEISEIPYDIQGKLLRVLEEHIVRRVGSVDEVKINCRILSATNELNLNLKDKQFRQDLYYRLRGTLLETTPLRERREDIELIVKYYDTESKIPKELIELWINDIIHFSFPGNIRELKNLIEEWICLNS